MLCIAHSPWGVPSKQDTGMLPEGDSQSGKEPRNSVIDSQPSKSLSAILLKRCLKTVYLHTYLSVDIYKLLL